MLELWYEVEMVGFTHGVKIENDPNYDPRIRIVYKNSTIASLWYIWKNRDAVVYINTFVLPSLLMWMVTKKSIFFGHESVFASEYSPHYRLKRWIVKLCYPFFTKIRVINQHDKELYPWWYQKKIEKKQYIRMQIFLCFDILFFRKKIRWQWFSPLR
jgi:hypothetical protein